MHKQPQNIIKISSQHEDGDYLQMVFDAGNMPHWFLTERFENFLQGLGYTISNDDNIVLEEEMSPKFEGPPESFSINPFTLTQEQSDTLLLDMLMDQYDTLASSPSKHPADIEYEATLMDSVMNVIQHNLSGAEFTKWAEQVRENDDASWNPAG